VDRTSAVRLPGEGNSLGGSTDFLDLQPMMVMDITNITINEIREHVVLLNIGFPGFVIGSYSRNPEEVE